MLLTTLSERDKESGRRSETFIHVGRIKRVDQETSFPRRTLEDTVGTMLRHYYFWNTRLRVRGD